MTTTTRRKFLGLLGGGAAAAVLAPAVLDSPPVKAAPVPTSTPPQFSASGGVWNLNEFAVRGEVFKVAALVPVSAEIMRDAVDVRSLVERDLAAKLQRKNDRLVLGG